MRVARLTAVNVVHALVPDPRGDLDETAIDKRPVPGRVPIHALGAEGDQQLDTRHHGGVDQALYAYAREDAAWWAAELGYDVPPGRFGENLSTEGLDVTGAAIGERWRIGDDGVLVQVTSPR
ncbi:MAG: MOSC domain-containing protein, partial [Actinomycetes bacterium]